MSEKKYIIEVINQSKHPLPAYKSALAAGMDICATLDSPITIPPKEWRMVQTGLYMALPIGFEAQVRGHRQLALTHGVTILNTPGTIDGDYRGELKVLLINHSTTPYKVTDGAPIAQLMVKRYAQAVWPTATTAMETKTPEKSFPAIMPCKVEVQNRSHHPLPHYASALAAGLDIAAALTKPVVIEPKQWATIPTGLNITIASGYEAEIRGRSGLSMRHGVTVLGGPYSFRKGQLSITLINYGEAPYQVEDGYRIAQLILNKHVPIHWREVTQFDALAGMNSRAAQDRDICEIKVIDQSRHALPAYTHSMDAGLNLRAALDAPVDIPPQQWVEISTRWHMHIPAGFEGQVRGLPNLIARGITLFDSPSTIDAGYHGELKVCIGNHSAHMYTIADGDPIAQLVVKSCIQAAWHEVECLADTARGVGGFGSTGIQVA